MFGFFVFLKNENIFNKFEFLSSDINEWMTTEVVNCFYPFDSNDFFIFEHMWWWLLHIKIVNSGYKEINEIWIWQNSIAKKKNLIHKFHDRQQ
jgi:hypothetical protein